MMEFWISVTHMLDIVRTIQYVPIPPQLWIWVFTVIMPCHGITFIPCIYHTFLSFIALTLYWKPCFQRNSQEAIAPVPIVKSRHIIIDLKTILGIAETW